MACQVVLIPIPYASCTLPLTDVYPYCADEQKHAGSIHMASGITGSTVAYLLISSV